MLLAIPAVLFLQTCLKKRYLILDILCSINILNGFYMAIFQPFHASRIVEDIIINNIVLLISVIAFIILTCKELVQEKLDIKRVTVLVCIVICSISGIIDIVLYYVRGTSYNLINTTVTFIIFFLILGVISIYDLRNRAERDLHTGLYNKSECLAKIKNKNILDETTVLFMFDLNNLKIVNDTYGHALGDKLILDFAQIILENVPMRAFAGRFGGDEFIIIMNKTDKFKVQQIISGMQRSTDKYNEDKNNDSKIKMSYSYGYALSTEFEQCTMQMLMKKADHEMYINKREYHNAQ